MKRQTLQMKLIFVFICIAGFVLLADLFIYVYINRRIDQINQIFQSNVTITTMSEQLVEVQDYLYQYLNTKSSASLELYDQAVQNYTASCMKLNRKMSDHEISMMEKNIYHMSDYYLEITEQTIQTKRGRNVEKYNESYAQTEAIFAYLKDYLISLNNDQFKCNASEYQILQRSLHYMEIFSIGILTALIGLSIMVIILLTKRLTKPLMQLAKTADQLAAGNFDIELLEVYTKDEIETLSKAFNTMVISLNDYIAKLKFSLELENEMKEKELMMENHLKDAQLKYLQAQINPHFLFNTLNAGVQMAMMENAEKTSVYIENVAEFFRYNIMDLSQDTTISEEIRLVDHYMHLLNVRFPNEITYLKQIDPLLLKQRMPRMILQPLVENAFQHGLRHREQEGIIQLSVERCKNQIWVSVTDNGVGMAAVSNRADDQHDCSNGIGLTNVIKRLQLYYGLAEVVLIESKLGQGTKIIIRIPEGESGLYVPNFDSR